MGSILVDFDGTLAYYESGSDLTSLGKPIPEMVQRIKDWLVLGQEVKIFTARVAASGKLTPRGSFDSLEFASAQRLMIESWCIEHIGQKLEVTATKDFDAYQIWDDRAVRVKVNEGCPCCDYYSKDPRKTTYSGQQFGQMFDAILAGIPIRAALEEKYSAEEDV